MLNRWTSMKSGMRTGAIQRKPHLSTDCRNVGEAIRWREQVVRQISKKVAEIQNAGLGEHRIRDLNDEINKHLRERMHWENRIYELDGPDFRDKSIAMYDADGRKLPGKDGYQYFGAAKNLPGVRELFEAEQPKELKRSRYDMYKGIDPDYYGYRDEDDGVLLAAEAAAEESAVAAEVKKWKRARREKQAAARAVAGAEGAAAAVAAADGDSSEQEETAGITASIASAASNAAYKAHVPVPSQADIEQLVLARKKKELLQKYATEEYLTAQMEARELMNNPI